MVNSHWIWPPDFCIQEQGVQKWEHWNLASKLLWYLRLDLRIGPSLGTTFGTALLEQVLFWIQVEWKNLIQSDLCNCMPVTETGRLTLFCCRAYFAGVLPSHCPYFPRVQDPFGRRKLLLPLNLDSCFIQL